MWTDSNEAIDQARNLILQLAALFWPEATFSLEEKSDLIKLRTELQRALMATEQLIKTGELHATR